MSVVRDRLGGGETGGEKASTRECVGRRGVGRETERNRHADVHPHVRACVRTGGRAVGRSGSSRGTEAETNFQNLLNRNH